MSDFCVRMKDLHKNYILIQKVGKGTYGTVYKAKNLKNKKFVALKKIQTQDPKIQEEGFPITALRQIKILKQMNHKNVLKLNQIIITKPNKQNFFRGSTYLVLDYMEHDFVGLFKNKIKFLPQQIKVGNQVNQCIIQQILQGVKYLHQNKIIHRDLKSANLLLNNKGQVKIGDFGLARNHSFDNKYTSKVVTLWYRAPQLLLGTKNYEDKIDIWSLGCIFAEFMTGSIIFKGDSQYKQIEQIYQICGSPKVNNWLDIQNYTNYKQMKPVKQYPIKIKEYLMSRNSDLKPQDVDFVQKLLCLNPKKRYSAQEALNHEYFKIQPLPCKIQEMPRLQIECHQMLTKNLEQYKQKMQMSSDSLSSRKNNNYKNNDKRNNIKNNYFQKDIYANYRQNNFNYYKNQREYQKDKYKRNYQQIQSFGHKKFKKY